MSETPKCPICRREALEVNRGTGGSRVRCSVCGTYRISGVLGGMLSGDTYDELRPYLSAETRQRTGEKLPPLLDEGNFEAVARAHMNTPVRTKIRRLLELLQSRTRYPGARAAFVPGTDYPLLDAVDPGEAVYFLRHLINAHLVDGNINTDSFEITIDGWRQLTPADSGGSPGTCFVAMSFDDDLTPAFAAGLSPAIADCGFEVIRVDRVEHNQNINDKILADLRAAQMVVADFTHHRPGVYFEAGFALGLGRVVIWTCREDDFDRAHFDTRPYNHVLWTSPQDLREKLTARIRGTVPFTPKVR